MARSSVAVISNINGRSLCIHNHKPLVSKDCVNPSSEHCCPAGPNCYVSLFGATWGTTAASGPAVLRDLSGRRFWEVYPWLLQLPSEKPQIWTLEKRMPIMLASTVSKFQHNPENQLQMHLLFTTVTCKVHSCRNSCWSSPSSSLCWWHGELCISWPLIRGPAVY